MADEQDNSTSPHGEPDPTSLPPLTTAPTTSPGITEGVVDAPGEMDAANQSLADALGVSFRVLRWLMLAILVIFILSGFFTVDADEVAIRTRFGRILPGPEGSEVLTAEGGPYFRWPAPAGNVYRVSTGSREVRLDEAFVFENARGPNAATPLQDLALAPGQGLDPIRDGYLLTGDGNIVHARYSVTYRIRPDEAATFLSNVVGTETLRYAERDEQLIFDDADALVRQAVAEAVVADTAARELDEFLGVGQAPPTPPTPATPATPAVTPTDPVDEVRADDPAAADAAADAGANAGAEAQTPAEPGGEGDAPDDATADEPPVAPTPPGAATGAQEQDRIRAQAQQTLNDLNSGIEIQAVIRTARDVPPPLRVVVEQSSVAQVYKDQLIRNARQQAASIYRTIAQEAYPAVLGVIEIYEEAELLREQEPERFEAAQQAMDAMFEGEPLRGPLETVQSLLPEEDPRRAELARLIERFGSSEIGGEARTIVRNARNRATQYIQQLQADASFFENQLASYRKNPDAVRQKLYLDMVGNVLNNPTAVKDVVSSRSEVVRLLLSEDVAIARRMEERQRQQQQNQPNETQPRQ